MSNAEDEIGGGKSIKDNHIEELWTVHIEAVREMQDG